MKIPIVTLDKPNKNNRIYPREVMKREMRKYRKTFVKEDRALIVGKQPEDSCINLKDVIIPRADKTTCSCSAQLRVRIFHPALNGVDHLIEE